MKSVVLDMVCNQTTRERSCDTIKLSILSNKNDSIEKTFCHELFENGFFSEEKIMLLIEQVKNIHCENKMDDDVKNVLIWIVNGVEQCFISHHDNDDLYFIKNYKSDYEMKWNMQWRKELLEYCK